MRQQVLWAQGVTVAIAERDAHGTILRARGDVDLEPEPGFLERGVWLDRPIRSGEEKRVRRGWGRRRPAERAGVLRDTRPELRVRVALPVPEPVQDRADLRHLRRGEEQVDVVHRPQGRVRVPGGRHVNALEGDGPQTARPAHVDQLADLVEDLGVARGVSGADGGQLC